MDWFQALTGFREGSYRETQTKLFVDGDRLHSAANSRSYRIGSLGLVSLEALRERATSASQPGRLKVSIVEGDVGKMHKAPEYAGAMFQVASQFNLLEMVSPEITPEHGVTRYQHDRTQGPACAIAAGAATIYRNYFVPVAGGYGQSAKEQLNALADLGETLSVALGQPQHELWTMQNGYALCSRRGLKSIAKYLETLKPTARDRLIGRLRIGLHQDVEVTTTPQSPGPRVSQAFCSALPVAYSDVPQNEWKEFACLILEAAYEATLLAGLFNAQRGNSNIVLLTFLGGGAFGNHESWIYSAMRRAISRVADVNLDVRLVSFGVPPQAFSQLAGEFM